MFGVPLINIAALIGSLGLSLAMWMPVKLALMALGLPITGSCVAFVGCMSTLIWLLYQGGLLLGY